MKIAIDVKDIKDQNGIIELAGLYKNLGKLGDH